MKHNKFGSAVTSVGRRGDLKVTSDNMRYNKFGSVYTYLPEACKQCWKGEKLVLFVTGVCYNKCYYCPISDLRKGKDEPWANERKILSDVDLLTEAKEMRARGAGITGGDPLAAIDRALHYIKLLNNEFTNFNTHLYNYGNLATKEIISKLEKAGLNEIRFHSFTNINNALDSSIEVGFEIPCVPGEDYDKFVDFAAENDLYLNLNEFELSDTNSESLNEKGFVPVNEESAAVKGSRSLALKTLEYAEERGVKAHFCPVKVKYALQLTERLKRRANTIKKSFEKVNKFGYIEKAVIVAPIEELEKIVEKYGKKVFLNTEKGRLETSRGIANKINVGKRFWVEEYPIHKPWDFESTPF